MMTTSHSKEQLNIESIGTAEGAILNVKHERIPSDNYSTPLEIAKWTVDRCRLISKKYCRKPSTKLLMLEPTCGDAAPFSRYAASKGMNAFGIDIRDVPTRHDVVVIPNQSFLDMPNEWTKTIYEQKYDVIATNPPFIYGMEVIRRSLDILAPTGVAAFNMKLSFLATQGRFEFFDKRPPSEIHVLSQRPSYAYGGTDRGQEYCILFWNGLEVDKKIRKKYGRISRTYWQDNKNWEIPRFTDFKENEDSGRKVIVEK